MNYSKQEKAESGVEKHKKSGRHSDTSQRKAAFNYPHELSILGFKSSHLKIKQEPPEEILAEDCQTENGEFFVDKSSISQRYASELADQEKKGLFCEAKNNVDNPELLTLGAGLTVLGGASSGQDYTSSASGFASTTKELSRLHSASTAGCTFMSSCSSSSSGSNPSISCSSSLNNESDSTNGRFVESDFTGSRGRFANNGGGTFSDRGISPKSSFVKDKEIVAEDIATAENEDIPILKSFQCGTCGKLFGFSRTLSIHKRIHTGERPFECGVCSKTFPDPSNYSRHMKNHQGLRNHQCDICNQPFTRLTSLERHSSRAHGLPKKSKTKSTNKKYTDTAKQRVVTPLNSRSLTCEICGKEWNDASSLQRHRTIHFIKPHVCNVCGKRFHHQDGLKSHAKNHLLIKPFNCEVCSKGFTERRFLTRHLKIHSGIKPHVCDNCGKGFVRVCSLKNHQRVYLAKKQFACEQ